MTKQKKLKFQAPTGMRDILPRDQKYYTEIYKVAKKIADFYMFGQIETPIVEEAELFSKGTGTSTDIVKKQMYSLKTRGGDWLALRPEATTSIVRAYIENGMHTFPQPVKLWHFGQFFRYERPQAGRYRQFWQLGYEVLGDQNPVIDAQVIQIFYSFLQELGFKNLVVEVNSIGDNQCRPCYKKLLVNYLRSRQASLCADCRRRFRENPLRVLDCKEEKCQRIIKSAPQIIDHLCKDCHDHLKEVLEFLDDLGLPYHLNPYLVRGLDYYTKTVFEIFLGPESSEELKEEKRPKNALAGGGRYDTLVKLLGGKDIPGCGGAAGVERIIREMKRTGYKLPKVKQPKIFIAQLGKGAKRISLKIMEDFRKAKIPIAQTLSKDSLNAQLKIADRLGSRYTLILGQKEIVEGEILIRDMKTGKQRSVKLGSITREMKKKI